MKTVTMILLGAIIGLALLSGCASTGTSAKTSQTQHLEDKTHVQSTDEFIDKMIY